MAKRLFVGRLPYSVNDKKLEEIFSEVGIVSSATVINDRDTGQSKGFGFVTMASQVEAETAVKAIAGKDILGRALVCNIAKPREPRFRF